MQKGVIERPRPGLDDLEQAEVKQKSQQTMIRVSMESLHGGDALALFPTAALGHLTAHCA